MRLCKAVVHVLGVRQVRAEFRRGMDVIERLDLLNDFGRRLANRFPRQSLASQRVLDRPRAIGLGGDAGDANRHGIVPLVNQCGDAGDGKTAGLLRELHISH